MSAGLVLHGVMRAADAARLAPGALVFGHLAAIVSPAPEDESEAAALALAHRHHDRLTALVDGGDILPVRLGAAFADEDAALRSLAGLSDKLTNKLAECAGAVELSLVADDVGATRLSTEAACGRDYLQARAAALAEARTRPARLAAALDALAAELTDAARAIVRRPVTAPRFCDLALLVQRGATYAVSNILDRRRAELEPLGLALSLRGPWPVYSFASLA